MKIQKRIRNFVFFLAVLSSSVLADQGKSGGASGQLRFAYIAASDGVGNREESVALGGKLAYETLEWNGLSANITFFTTHAVAADDESSFFGSDGKGYSLLGEAWLQAKYDNNSVRIGRISIDTPYADTDDMRMIPNTFQGMEVAIKTIADTRFTVMYLDRWAGVDASIPEKFTKINGDEGVAVLGAVYEGFANMGLQSWYYYANDFADLGYLEASYTTEFFSAAVQYTKQTEKSAGISGAEGSSLGLLGGLTINDVGLSLAYNKVDGVVINGFGGGPYFTSADDHTIEGVHDEEAVLLGMEYTGANKLILGISHTDFNKQENETDLMADYEVSQNLHVSLIHADMNSDGNSSRLLFNLDF